MRNVTRFAQATGVPNNGASNAYDFQPTTRNPQNPAGTTQQTGGVQQPLGHDVLSNPNLRITVPVNPAEKTEPAPPAPKAGFDWLPIIIVSVVLVAAAELFLRSREKRRRAQPADTGESEKTYLSDNQADESTEQRVEEMMGPAEERTSSASVTTSEPKKSKKKSKLKRKKR